MDKKAQKPKQKEAGKRKKVTSKDLKKIKGGLRRFAGYECSDSLGQVIKA